MIIGLSGAAGAGKDTTAEIFTKHGFKRYAFADAVREMALTVNPVLSTNWQSDPEDYLQVRLKEIRLSDAVDTYGWDEAKRNIGEVRRLLQVIGTEVGRNLISENFWVDTIERKMAADGWPDAVITDMRFPNELDWVQEQNGITILVTRSNNTNYIGTSHASEQAKLECDYVLQNDGTFANLATSVECLLAEINSE